MFLLDSTSKPGSDSGYTPGDNSKRTYKPIDGLDESEVYPSMNQGQTADPSFDSYESQNKENFSNPEFKNSAPQSDRQRQIEEAKKFMQRSSSNLSSRLGDKIGAPQNVTNALRGNTAQDREVVKDYAKDYAKEKSTDFAKDKIGSQLSGGLQKSFEKGISQGAKKTAGKTAGKAVAKGATEVATKAGARVGAAAGVEAGIASAGAVAGAASFGLGFILSLFLDIAISLGINDAVDALFELKEGNVKHATFLAMRAVVKVEVFIWFLLTVVFMFSIAGIFFAIPSLIILNIYMVLGSIPALKSIPHFQGLVLWEKIVLVIIDFIAFLILAAFIGGIVYYLCSTSGLGGGGVTGAFTSAAVSVYDWWNGTTAGSFANDICKNVNAQ